MDHEEELEKTKKPPPPQQQQQQQSSPSSAQLCIDIHHEEAPHTPRGAAGSSSSYTHKPVKHVRVREHKKSFSRQVSLETGFSALRGKGGGGVGGGREGEDDHDHGRRSSLPRSGRSLGAAAGIGLSPRGGGGGGGDAGRKRDFNMFRTKSTLAKQHSFLPMKKESETDHHNHHQHHHHQNQKGGVGGGNGGDNGGGRTSEGSDDSVNQSVPAGRYFAALTGPELDQVKEHEDILLPKDEKWPFLLRFPIGSFGICLGLSSQTILWQSLATSPATRFLHITPYINLLLWILAVLMLLLVSTTYLLKSLFYFEAVRREYFHPVRVNFFFAPWVVCMFLTIGAPKLLVAPSGGPPHPALFCAFMAPIFALELKIYGQWLSGGKRRLSKVANPSSHLSVVGNFVGAILAAKVGWVEPAKFFWAVGFAHYLVLFVTLYQRLPTSEVLPKELHPVYSMFIAAPSAASIAWSNIYGEFDGCSRTCYFIALFLYTLLFVRPNFFWGFRFSVAWWSYTFPMTTASIATIKYAEQVPSVATKVLALGLSFVSSTMVSVLIISTLLHAFVWRTLFPNDLAIAITKRKHGAAAVVPVKKKQGKKGYDIRRWAKQSPLSIVSSAISKNTSSISKDDDEEEDHHRL